MKHLKFNIKMATAIITLSLGACATSGQDKYSYSEIVALEEFAVADAARRPAPASLAPVQAPAVYQAPIRRPALEQGLLPARGAMLTLSQACGVHAEASATSPKHSTMPMGKKLWVTPLADNPEWIVVQRASGPAYMSRACF